MCAMREAPRQVAGIPGTLTNVLDLALNLPTWNLPFKLGSSGP